MTCGTPSTSSKRKDAAPAPPSTTADSNRQSSSAAIARRQRSRSAARRAPRRLGAVDEPRGVGAHLLRRAHRKALGADDRQREGVQGGERCAERGRGAAAGRQVRGVDAVAGQEVDDDGARVADAGFAEQLGRAEGEETAHAGGERAERAHLGGELGSGGVVRGNAHDHAATVVEIGDRGVVAAGGAFGERADSDDADPGQSRRHGRG